MRSLQKAAPAETPLKAPVEAPAETPVETPVSIGSKELFLIFKSSLIISYYSFFGRPNFEALFGCIEAEFSK